MRQFKRYNNRRPYKRRFPNKQQRIRKLVTGASESRFQRIAKQGGQAGALARSLRYVVKETNAEKKFIDITGVNLTVSVLTPYIVGLTNVAQGTTDITRIGNSIKLQHLQINFLVRAFYNNIAIPSGYVTFRVMIIVDKHKNGAAPTTPALTDVLQSAALLSNKNIDFQDRFVILKDKWITLNQTNDLVAATNGSEKFWKWYIPLDFHTRYVGINSAEASNSFNSIYMIAISDDNTVSGGQFLTFASRVVFTDD